MSTQHNDMNWLLSGDFELYTTKLSNNDSIDLLCEKESANEDIWEIIGCTDEEWEAATAEGFFIF